MSDSEGVERRGWEDDLNAAWALVDIWRGRFEDAAARETALHKQLAEMCDDEAVKRAADALGRYMHGRSYQFVLGAAEAVLRAAGAQQDAAAKPKASGPDA